MFLSQKLTTLACPVSLHVVSSMKEPAVECTAPVSCFTTQCPSEKSHPAGQNSLDSSQAETSR